MTLIMFVLCLFGLIIVFTSASSDDLTSARNLRRAKMVKDLEEDFQRYPNMSLVLLDKCSKLAPHKIAPCTLSVLDNDQVLLMGMLKTNPFSLINMINKHIAAFPNIPVRVMKDGSQCKKPELIHDKLSDLYHQFAGKQSQKTTQ